MEGEEPSDIIQFPVLFYNVPVEMQCPSCNQTIVTSVSFNAGLLTWLCCAGLFLFGCWIGCCLIPFCADSLMDTAHHCPNCNALLGTYRRRL
ncbi:lipopolysaccharide-induced tumor necrosis factor-alpha factor homolog isoform X2 [Hemicordylus capensis]|nr:lipopolysaccharide-induced tumor necrosis factor-alpha factor homolog isoform X2 [Hemicordylus capensis]XP_053133032.1 lipopolysaccharide-induced tumor necrosis factor-alpha factor homolog isoform X2 [Hemicordylus capensis]XP_053133034.1 lipopolysaccharide-induced tumor necrosis factor-alpha factor homolog isoform X2 [Hemicordylus capensis]XP_053133035.1 lipopolysaccharide-induced tumor necrosis factor-alpha factor homolog isoform X2 [Hemicordylus capensis]XP_053133036.1 lipopolysaccharide-i